MYLFTYTPTFFNWNNWKSVPTERPPSPGPSSPPSKSLVLRLFLCFLVPAILSTNSIQDGDFQGSLDWIKYFIVLSFLLLLECLLDCCCCSKLQTKPWVSTSYKLFKLGLIVWCLAPTQYNGSELTYTHVLAPLFHLSRDVAFYFTDVTPVVIDKLVDGTVTGLQIMGQSVQTAGEYLISGFQCVACTIKCGLNLATEYFLTGADIVFTPIGNYLSIAGSYTLSGAEIAFSATGNYLSIAGSYSLSWAKIAFSAIGDYISIAGEYFLTGCEIALSGLSHYAIVAAEYSLAGTEIALATLSHWASLAADYCIFAFETCIEYTPIILGEIYEFSENVYSLSKLLLKAFSREISNFASISGQILAKIFCNTICGLRSSLVKLGEIIQTIVLVSLDLLTKAKSTGEEYRLMAKLLRGDKGDQPRRLISDWFREQSALIG